MEPSAIRERTPRIPLGAQGAPAPCGRRYSVGWVERNAKPITGGAARRVADGFRCAQPILRHVRDRLTAFVLLCGSNRVTNGNICRDERTDLRLVRVLAADFLLGASAVLWHGHARAEKKRGYDQRSQ